MDVTIIENENLRLGITPGYGARVVSLVDKASGREWMTKGSESPNTGEDAIYRSPEAVAWDECFPTVSPWDASTTPWHRRLRDHGDLWGRPWRVDARSVSALTLTYADPQFSFTRELRLEHSSVIADYAAINLGSEPLPYLWALHALLAVEPGDRIELPRVDEVRGPYLSLRGKTLPARALPWSGANGALPFPLDEVQPRDTDFAGKFYASGVAGGSARIGRPGQWLTIAWDGSIADIGIWLTYGGWPQKGGHQEIAIEPTSSAADHLGQAIELGTKPLAPGERRTWRVTLTASA